MPCVDSVSVVVVVVELTAEAHSSQQAPPRFCSTDWLQPEPPCRHSLCCFLRSLYPLQAQGSFSLPVYSTSHLMFY